MRFLYSGAKVYLTPQPDPKMSLGGLVSSSVVPNSRLNNLFSDASYSSVKEGLTETYALILENESSVTVTSLTLGYQYVANPLSTFNSDYNNDYNIDFLNQKKIANDFSIRIAAVTLNANQVMEQIGNSNDMPYVGNFSEAMIDPANRIDNSLSLGTMTAGQRLGIWIQRIQKRQTLVPVDFSLPIAPIIDSTIFVMTWN